MKLFLTIFAWVVGLVLLAAIGYFGYRYFTAKADATAETPEATIKITPIRIIKATRGTVREHLLLTGEVQASRTVDVFSKVVGRLETLRTKAGALLEEGTYVSSGDTVAIIDHKRLLVEVVQAEAVVGVARAELRRADVNVRDALADRKRFENLFASGAATGQQRDTYVIQHERAEAEKALAEARIKQAGAVLDAAKVDLSEATIVSPMDAVVSEKYLDEGNMVTLSSPIVQLMEARGKGDANKSAIRVKVAIHLPPRWLRKVNVGETPAVVRVDEHPDEEFTGILRKIYPTASRKSRTSEAEIAVENRGGRLRPGMFARVRLITATSEGAVVLHRDAVLEDEKGLHVFVIEGKRARRVGVKIGLRERIRVEVLEGLDGGESIAFTGAKFLKDGDAVNVVSEESIE
ncbi:MAG: efflux RND transporter periplasmic adaptor subunit [Planctomycetia bacterium]|nr:efflux RND transporter periplasmic adaptor subunit [Planctomycetia bacterium]